MYNKKFNPSKVTTINADWRSVPWEMCNKIWTDAADSAEATALAEHEQRYLEMIARKEAEYNAVNEAPYEGNFSDETPMPPLPNKRKIRYRAGNKAVIADFIPRYKIESFGITYLRQIMEHIGTFKLPTMAGETFSPAEYYDTWIDKVPVSIDSEDGKDNQISGLDFLKAYFSTPQMLGVYRFLMLDTRSSFVKQQYKGEARAYCTLVPSILFVFKSRFNIPYVAWNRDELELVVPESLCAAMLWEDPTADYSTIPFTTELTSGNILEARKEGLTWKSGEHTGKQRDPTYTHKLFGISHTTLGKQPALVQVMLAQIWCAHPDNRTKYMVLTPGYWDSIPKPLISSAVLDEQVDVINTDRFTDTPW